MEAYIKVIKVKAKAEEQKREMDATAAVKNLFKTIKNSIKLKFKPSTQASVSHTPFFVAF